MSRHAGLVDIEGVDNVIHLLLAAPERLDDLPAGPICKRLKSIHMRQYTYTPWRMQDRIPFPDRLLRRPSIWGGGVHDCFEFRGIRRAPEDV